MFCKAAPSTKESKDLVLNLYLATYQPPHLLNECKDLPHLLEVCCEVGVGAEG